jgi:phosphate transport system permease protein
MAMSTPKQREKIAPQPPSVGLFRIPNFGDRVFKCICIAAAGWVVFLFVLLAAVLTWQSWTAISTNGLNFFTSPNWDPSDNGRTFGSLAMVYGTVVTSAIAMLIAVPLGIGTATFLSEIASSGVRRVVSFLVEMLAAIPSVVYGFWALLTLAPLLQPMISDMGGPTLPKTGGLSLLTAGLILAIMVLPYVAAVSFDVCRAVPQSQREAALALGASRWQMIWTAVLPFARPGIIGACFLALGRAIGETMAVTMVIGATPRIFWTPLAPGESIASQIATQFNEASYQLFQSSLTELALVLLMVSVIINSLARFLIWRMTRPPSHAAEGAQTFWRQLLSFASTALGWLMTRGIPILGLSYISHFLLALIFRTPEYLPLGSLYEKTQLGDESLNCPALVNVPLLVVFWTTFIWGTRFLIAWKVKNSTKFAKVTNNIMTTVLGLCAVLTVIPLFIILTYLLVEGVTSLNWQFFIGLPQPPGEAGGGMRNALYGSAVMVALASILAIPFGLLAAIYLAEYKTNWFGNIVRFVGELLVGVPSIAVGLVGYFLLVRPMQGNSGWAGALVLSIMMIPIVMRASEESLKLVPRPLRLASFALGASQWQTVLRVVVPAALPAIITGVFLSIARIGGETAPLLLTAGYTQFMPGSPNDQMPSVPVLIYTYAISPYPNWHRQAWAAALVLLVVVMLLNFGIRFLTGKRVLLASRAD